MLEQNGKFYVKNVWQYIKQKDEKQEIFKNMWINKLPFQMTFTLWRAWKFIIPINEVVQRMKISLPSRCHCCQHPQRDTMSHVLLTSYTVERLRRKFSMCAGINHAGLQLSQLIIKWWTWPGSTQLRQAHSIIISELWKRRNNLKHGGTISFNWLVHKVNTNIWQLTKF